MAKRRPHLQEDNLYSNFLTAKVANPEDAPNAETLWFFDFSKGSYEVLRVYVWEHDFRGIEGALEKAAASLPPGFFLDDRQVQSFLEDGEEDSSDYIQTESGFIPAENVGGGQKVTGADKRLIRNASAAMSGRKSREQGY